ncbi:MAG TPA: glycosyltransferase [Chloroflexaceae bacterium]|nr:glycosyltransferase [Chloroflexaceae bacterium]
MSAAVIVLTWNGGDEAVACLAALAALDPAPATVVVVDNASADGTPDTVAAQFPAFTLIRNERNLGFAGGMNAGLRRLLDGPAPPEVVALLNQDTVVDPGWLGAITAPFADPAVGAVGCKIRYPDGTIQHAGVTLDWPRALARHVGWHERDAGQHDAPRDAELLTFAAVALRAAALRRVGLLDEGYGPAYFEDLDLCARLRRAGYTLRYEPRATLVHQESSSLRDELARSARYNYGRLRFVLKTYSPRDLRGAFAEAEAAFIRLHGHDPEGRALRWAYSETLAALPGLVAARRELEPDLPAEAEAAMAELVRGLRRELARNFHRRAAACADALLVL